jgi:hypothetical protein
VERDAVVLRFDEPRRDPLAPRLGQPGEALLRCEALVVGELVAFGRAGLAFLADAGEVDPRVDGWGRRLGPAGLLALGVERST